MFWNRGRFINISKSCQTAVEACFKNIPSAIELSPLFPNYIMLTGTRLRLGPHYIMWHILLYEFKLPLLSWVRRWSTKWKEKYATTRLSFCVCLSICCLSLFLAASRIVVFLLLMWKIFSDINPRPEPFFEGQTSNSGKMSQGFWNDRNFYQTPHNGQSQSFNLLSEFCFAWLSMCVW